jgi:pimeloyl-ACP methyl ester carboxylesterase
MTLLALALLLQPIAGAKRDYSPADTLVDVGGYRAHLVVHRGTKPLTIVMESGGGASLTAWSGVDGQLAERTGATVVAYDRAGFGTSDTGPWDLKPRRQVEQLDRVLEQLGTPPERIVVGTSYGGLLAVLHASLFPEKVRGLVLVDPMNPRFVAATGDFIYSTVPHIDHPKTARDTALARLVNTFPDLVHDGAVHDAKLSKPLIVITAGEAWLGKQEIDRAWRASHEAMAKAGPGRRLVVAERSKHDIAGQRPDTIVDAVLTLMDARPDPGAPQRGSGPP